MKVGGPAEFFFQPADLKDLMNFLSKLPDSTSLFPIGVGSNLIVRDGGLKGVVIRLGRGFNSVEFLNGLVVAGAAALDSFVARKAADHGYDLTFLRTIPGSIGGALKMNAGCYGKYTSDYFVSAKAVNRSGDLVKLEKSDVLFSYRNTDLPTDLVVVEVTEVRIAHVVAHDEDHVRGCLARGDADQRQQRERTEGGHAVVTLGSDG